MRLKQLLRKQGIAWSPAVAHRTDYFGSQAGAGGGGGGSGLAVRAAPRAVATRRTRASIAALQEETKSRLPYLPTEVQLRILHYALTSSDPIVDPLSPAKAENMTARERGRGNKIAIGFLATCRAFSAEGQRALWCNNDFVFTTVEALRNFAELDLNLRKHMTHVNLRIIARFYDDEDRKHVLSKEYHGSMKKDVPLKVTARQKEVNLARKGFRCYTWLQLIDFLDALRPLFDPKQDKKSPRLRLFPNLETMRIDFVNFQEYFLPYSASDLHDMAAHELGCSLDELIVTGLPCCDVGMKVGADLSGMVRDDGLFLDGNPSFVQLKHSLKPLAGHAYCAKVVRAWRKGLKAAKKAAAAAHDDQSDLDSDPETGHSHANLPDMPSAPDQVGHPESTFRRRKTVWKKVPPSRDSEDRKWVEFDRSSGYPMEDLVDLWDDSDEEDEVGFCHKCGEYHDLDDMDE